MRRNRECRFIIAAGEIVPSHRGISVGNPGDCIHIVRLLARRLAEGFEGKAGATHAQLGTGKCDLRIDRPRLRRRIGDRTDLDPVGGLAAAGREKACGDEKRVDGFCHDQFPLSAGRTDRMTRIAAGSISTPIIVGSMQATSGMEISTGRR